ncbi:hypothetical protein Tel_07720 [Candidatus Tenderia electrophaga]|jgi:Tfp pilus assembly protein PilF|uniref:Uncharacterized protein n=1 Tax=Candidatus Tenderia electrophaga TaxID=1748243 RepID=A0A0S2TD23_9GAMM|nr:hypothetical protein Tel_07720 [Candidatus Tenderia electrophaga]
MPKKTLKTQLKYAEKLRKAGKLVQAKSTYFECCKLNPDDYACWQAFGQISYQLQHHKDASTAFQRAISINPNLDKLYYQLALSQSSLGEYVAAERNFRSYLMMRPDAGAGYWAYARLLHDWGRIAEATENYQKASEQVPNATMLHLEFGIILQKQGRYDEALEQFLKMQALQPDHASVYNHLGNVYRDMGRFAAALASYQKAFALAPGDEAKFHFYLATLDESRGEPSAALSHYDKAIALDENLADAHLNRAVCLLLLGNYKEGWSEYEWRLQHPDWLRQRHLRVTDRPRWRGESWPEKTLLVIAEQGYGDTFQFCRFVSPLARHFTRVLVYCKPEIAALIELVEGVDEVIPAGRQLPPEAFDTYVYMMSLPRLLATTFDTIPRDIPYMYAPEKRVAAWRGRLASDGLKVGLAWSGSPANAKNVLRQVALSELAPLGDVSGVRFFGLQKGPGSGQALSPPASMRFTDLSNALNDFADTAAVIAGLDLVISVDSAVAHLAGALGKPVWVLLYTPPDWRYGMAGEASPWYPTMRIFRQRDRGDWTPVINRLQTELQGLAG